MPHVIFHASFETNNLGKGNGILSYREKGARAKRLGTTDIGLTQQRSRTGGDLYTTLFAIYRQPQNKKTVKDIKKGVNKSVTTFANDTIQYNTIFV